MYTTIIRRSAYCLVCLLFLYAGVLHAQGFLRTKDRQIVNGKGKEIILRGMGLGGWMLQEGYMFRLGAIGRQYLIKEKIGELVGAEKTKQFYDAWLLNHTTKADIDSMAAWGFNSIRLPMHYALFTLPVDEEPVAGKNTWLEKGFEMTDKLLQWCRQHKIYLILDLHAAPGGQGNDLPISDRDPAKPSLWESEANRQKTIELWRKLAARYAKEEWIGGYDILNEPNWGFDDPKDFRGTNEKNNIPLQKLMKDITAAIRTADKHHIIIIEGNGFGNNYNGITPVWDDNLVMSFHKYGNFNTTGSIRHFLDLREKFNIPLWLGESGENANTWFTEAIGLAERNDIGWAWWQEKKMGLNNPLEIRQPEGYVQLVDYMTGKTKEKPSEAAAWSVLQQLLENLKIKNNIFHPDVVDAMFRQVSKTGTKPFRQLVIGSGSSEIRAVDFDMGSQRVAYYDTDTARYQYTPGVNTVGNRGGAYRNDGVDIAKDANGYYVFSTEEGEWLQYTVTVKEAGNYALSYSVAAEKEGSRISLLKEGIALAGETAVPATGGFQNWQQTGHRQVFLAKGTYPLRIRFDTGGCNLKAITFTRMH
ncbi:cellulase family glycosylhydrolase [Sediminibacterium soli]|uniref:cellulase family glycosylhydrolase n=1 Tax=Sediminibacterium soli TaxID=2698829 RepID=UPI00137B7495|nr:cellulase family glycosylhydrolase [Sediminibacterium soli]NCI45316.1 cellulase family glycosylhydrolase [Sediminibacterium soli]